MDRFYVCRVAISPLRKEASDRAEMVSQLLFGDRVLVIVKSERWWKVITHDDDYEGWLDPKQLIQLTESDYHDSSNFRYVSPLHLENRILDEQGTSYLLSPGSTLPFYNNGYCHLGTLKFQVCFTPLLPISVDLDKQILNTALYFQNTSYLWGGRNLMGIDCSGFSQIVFKLLGIALPRDASQQVICGQVVDFLEYAQLGDLAFFDNAEGNIVHVGIMLANDKIIHAAGRVRIDKIDTQGIYNDELDKYTHQLRIIKRLNHH